MRQYGNKRRTQAEKRTAALQYLTFKHELTGDEITTLERSYGLSQPEAIKLFNEVRRRRVA